MAAGPVTVMARNFVTSVGTDTNTPTSNASTVPIVTVAFDAVVSESHEGGNTVTAHPVEEGPDISDHSRPDPDELTLAVIISNTPINPTQQQRAAQALSIPPAQANDGVKMQPGYAESCVQKLWDLKDSGTLVTAITQLRSYTTMMITHISVPRDSKTFNSATFTLVMRKIRIVKNKLTKQVVSKKKNVTEKVKTGTQTPDQGEVPASTLASMKEGAAGKEGFGAKVAGALGALVK